MDSTHFTLMVLPTARIIIPAAGYGARPPLTPAMMYMYYVWTAPCTTLNIGRREFG